jgi:hypothetical protein
MSIVELLETYKIDEESLIEDQRGELSYLQNFLTNARIDIIKMIQNYKSDPKNNRRVPIGSVSMAFSNPKTIKHAIIENKADYLLEYTDNSVLKNFFMNRARGICMFYELLLKLSTTKNGTFIRQIRELNEYMVNLHDREINVANFSDIPKLKIRWDGDYYYFIIKRKIAYMKLLDICIAFYSSGYEYMPPYGILFIVDMYPDNYFLLDIGDSSYFTLARYEKINLIESVRNYVVKLRNLEQ